MTTPFWSLAAELAALPEFTATAAEQGEGAITLLMRHTSSGRTVRATLREGPPRRGELALGDVALAYDLGGLPVDEAKALGLVGWLERLARSHVRWRSLQTAEPDLGAALRRLEGVAGPGPLEGFRLAPTASSDARVSLDFGEPRTERRVLLEVARSSEGERQVRARHRTPAPLALQHAIRVASAVALSARSHDAGTSASSAKRSLEVVTARDAPQGEEVRLILNGPCEQHCAFCSIPDTFPPSDEGDAELEGHRAVLDARFATGARILRLTGVDPLASSFIVPLLEHARALGYEEVMINSPCTRLSDRAFAEAVTRALPPRRGVMVPLYGADAEAHDEVVGRPGAHARVMQALDHLQALLGPSDVQLSTVLVPRVLENVEALVALARRRALPLNVYLPFPDADSPFDRFTAVSLPQRSIAERLVASGALRPRELLAVRGLAPCVVLRALEESGAQELAAAQLELRSMRDTLYDGARTPHQPCAHRARCSLTPPCTGELLTAYVRRHGEQEFAPPSSPR